MQFTFYPRKKLRAKSYQTLFSYLAKIKQIPKGDYSLPESFLFLPLDPKPLAQVQELVSNLKSFPYSKIFLLGIGGSNLGVLALVQAFAGKLKKKIYFADTIDPKQIRFCQTEIESAKRKKESMLFLLISKSGKTFETIAHFGLQMNWLRNYPKKKIIVITDENSPLANLAQKNQFLLFTLPPKITGRYSVFTLVGLIPLALLGFSLQKLLLGVKIANRKYLAQKKNNPAIISADFIWQHYQKGYQVFNQFLWDQRLESLGIWYRQLLAESIGKERKGILPILTYGNIDLHTIGQLYFDGPRNILTRFLTVSSETKISSEEINFPGLNQLIANIEKKKITHLRKMIIQGVEKAYQKLLLPYSKIELTKISEQAMAELMQFFMIETIFLAKLLSVNAFDQPAVESYKKEVRRLLNS